MFERVDTTLNGADNNVAALEVRVHRPRTVERRLAPNLVILGMDIEEGRLLEQRPGIVLVNRGDVYDAQPGAVVSLVRKAFDDVLVVVDGPLRALVNAAEHGVLEVLDVDDVRRGVLVLSGARLLLLVELVVEEEVLVVGRQPALVRVRGTVVRGPRQLPRHRAPIDVHDRQRVLVVIEADLAPLVRLLGAAVDDALRVVDVAVLADAAGILRALGVRDVDHPEAAAALEVRLGADSDDEVGLLVRDDVVAGAEAVEVRRDIAGAEGDRALGVDFQELRQVKDLEAVVGGLRADVGVVADDLDVTPGGGIGVGWQAGDVLEASVLEHLHKRRAVGLAEESKLAAIARRPA